MSKYKCEQACIAGCTVETNGTRPAPDRCLYTGNKAKWEPVEGIVEKAMKETQQKLVDKICPRPELTAEVFNRPDCPEWAKWATVDRSGVVCLWEKKPRCDNIQMWLRGNVGECVISLKCNLFDASDWQNSLIERPEKKELRHTPDFLPIRFKKLHPDAKAPYQATPGSAGWDLTAVSVEPVEGDAFLARYGTGLAVEIPAGHVGLVFPRSSVYKTNQLLTNCVGVIDSDYRGEITAVFSKGIRGVAYEVGDRIAQLVIMPIPAVKFVEAETLTETQRGTGGYGSTGR